MIDFEKIKVDIANLYEECLDIKTPFHRKLDLFIMPDDLIKLVLEQVSIDLSNHWVCIDNFGIIHTLEQHGNPITEAKRGQVAVQKEDFITFLDVFLKPDVVKIVGVTKRTNLPLLQFEKEVHDKRIIIKEMRTVTSIKKKKVSRLVFHTMYKIKKSNR